MITDDSSVIDSSPLKFSFNQLINIFQGKTLFYQKESQQSSSVKLLAYKTFSLLLARYISQNVPRCRISQQNIALAHDEKYCSV